ncbi:MAG TPA: lipoprotein [Lysobacter sp.]|nr:lipoprotein [Lysobacter sp.]
MNATTRIAITAAVLATLAGCGNKGPLVLATEPPIDPTTVPEAAAPTDATPTETPIEQPPADEDAADPPVTPPAEVPADGDGNG